MKGVMSILARAGLVELDAAAEAATDSPVSKLAGETPASAPAAAAASAPTDMAAALAKEQVDFARIYADMGIATARYPAERMLRVLDGLQALDPASRLLSVRAIDEADDSWSVADPLDDARMKIAALGAYADQVRANVAADDAEAESLRSELAQRSEQTVGEIRRQIAELQALLERETAKAATERTELDAALSSARARANQQLATIDVEAKRLGSLIATLEPGPSSAAST